MLQGAGTDDNTLIRVMASRSEVDMLDIRAEFRKMFAGSLHNMIKVHTSNNQQETRHIKMVDPSSVTRHFFLYFEAYRLITCFGCVCVCYREILAATTERLYCWSAVEMMHKLDSGNNRNNESASLQVSPMACWRSETQRK